MRGKGCQITSLTSNLAVSNYPERTVSEDLLHEPSTECRFSCCQFLKLVAASAR